MVDEVLRSVGGTRSDASPGDTVDYGSLAAPWGFAARYIPRDLTGRWVDVIPLSAGRTGVLLGCCAQDPHPTADRLRGQARAELLRTADPVYSLAGTADVELSALCAVIDGNTMLFSISGDSDAALSAPGAAPVRLTATAGRVAVSPLPPGATVLLSTRPIPSPAGLLADCADLPPDQVADRVIQALNGTGCAAAVLYRHPPPPLRFSMPADPTCLAASRGALRTWLTAAGLEAEDSADMLLAAGEATANATEHAVRGAADPVDIALEADLSESTLRLTVSDNGRWKPTGTPGGHRGHGLRLIEALVDSLELTTGPQGTTVAMVKEMPR
jgi:anti-sigma regulatory factor (Ser/Thr protein kinase)